MRIALGGGNSNTLGYFRLHKEIHEKNLYNDIEVLSGMSGGALYGGSISMHKTPEEAKNILVGLPGDKTMIYFEDIMHKDGNIMSRTYKMLYVLYKIRTSLSDDIVDYLDRIYDWKQCKIKSYFGITPLNLLTIENGLKNTFFGAIHFKKNLEYLREILYYNKEHNSPVYFSNDGTYTIKLGKFVKISSETISMGFAIRCSFLTPPFKMLRLFTGSGYYVPIDGGLLDNYACAPHLGEKFISISPMLAPKDENNINSYHFHMNLPIKSLKVDAVSRDNEFFSFYKNIVEKEYNQPATNLL
jgi:hypothetical protein